MKPKIIQKIEKEQFELEQKSMAAGLSALDVPQENQAEVLRYFRWLCFDRILLRQQWSDTLKQQVQRHRESYDYALDRAFVGRKLCITDWDKAGLAMQAVYQESVKQR